MQSLAVRTAAYLLAEALMLLLRALLDAADDVPAETAEALKQSIEHLVRSLKQIAETGQEPAELAAPADGDRPPYVRNRLLPRPARLRTAERRPAMRATIVATRPHRTLAIPKPRAIHPPKPRRNRPETAALPLA